LEKTSILGISAATCAAALSALPAVALAENVQGAQNGDASSSGEIVVTAQRREERSVDVPITLTTLSSAQLATANARELADISKITPSLRFDAASGFVQPTIRGIGTSVATSGGGANVGIYIDGFYSPNPLSANSQLMNIESVQILKGPQGTLFGRNTTGGAILIQSAQPSEDPGGRFKLSYGRFNDVQAQFYGTTGIAPGVAFDVEGSFRHGDGFQTNIVNGDDKVGQYTTYSVRAGLKVNIGETGSLLLRYTHAEVDDPRPMTTNSYVDPVLGVGAPYFVQPGQYVTEPNLVAQDLPSLFTSRSDTIQATLNLDLGFADLTSYSQYRREKANHSQNMDATAARVFQLGLPVKNSTISQEFLLNSKPGSALQWTGGLFYFRNKDRWLTFSDLGGPLRDPNGPNRIAGSGTVTESYAAFIDATYELTPQLFLTAGARYAHDRVTDAFYNVGTAVYPVPSIKNDKITPRIVLRYKPSDSSSIYASYTQGYKAAVIDVGGSCQNPPAFTCSDIQPEKVHAYEVGAKFGSRALTVEAAAFYYDYKNLQVSSYLADGRANITNAASSEIYGLEGAVRLRVTDNFDVNAGAAWTHARYKEFNNAPVYVACTDPVTCGAYSFVIPTGTLLHNVSMQRTPEFTGNVGAVYRTDLAGGELQASGNVYFTSEFYFGPSGIQFPQKGYEVVTARLQWTDPSDAYTLALWADNLTNNRYVTAVQYNSFGLGANWSAPTTYGVELVFKF